MPIARSAKSRIGLAAVALLVVGATATAATVASAKPSNRAATIKVGLITKDVTNPFFVKMKAGATAQAKKLGAQLVYAAGKNSSDNASQIAAIENMVTAGVKGILITVADAKAENAAIAKARKAGVIVIALDSPTDPTTAVNALFATNNLNAGDPDRQIRARRDQGQEGDDRDARRACGFVGRGAPSQRLHKRIRDQEQR